MESAARQLLELRRDVLLAENRRLEREKNAATESAVKHPDFSPFSNTVADRLATQIFQQQEEVINQLLEVDRQLRGLTEGPG